MDALDMGQRENSLSNIDAPASWYYACAASDLARGPQRVTVASEQFVVFRAASGNIAVLRARCVHMGADLSSGQVVGENLQCPLHGWEFSAGGQCVRIPASATVPDFARQPSFPCVHFGGHIFFYNRSRAAFEAPFFEGRSPRDLLPARPFVYDANIPWYMAGANGFDLQHFGGAHDRTLLDEPRVDQPSPFARRIRATFAVTGTTIRDRLTRRFSGPQVTMTVTSWCGTLMFVTAEFRRTTSFGLVCVIPINASRTRLRTIVWVERSRRAIGRSLLDPVSAAIRRSFIRAFLRADQKRTEGIRYNPATLIDADAVLKAYFNWLTRVATTSGLPVLADDAGGHPSLPAVATAESDASKPAHATQSADPTRLHD